MYKVLVACIENWDTLMELPAVLVKGGCSVDVYCSKKSWLLKNRFYNNWIECPTDLEQYKFRLMQLAENDDPYYDWIILADEKLLSIFSKCSNINNQALCKRILPIIKLENKVLLGSKNGLNELCIKYGITIPSYLSYNHEPDFDAKNIGLQFPILLKQDLSWGGGGIILCNNQADFELELKTLNKDYPFVFQEFISGTDIGIEAFYSDGILLNYSAGEVATYFKSKFGFTTSRIYFLSDEIKALLERLGEAFGINGFASIQVIYKNFENVFYLIEVDLRPNFYVSYGQFTGNNFSEAIKKKIDPSYIIPSNKILNKGEKMEIAIFYRDVIRCFNQKDIRGLFKWVLNHKGYWRFIPIYDLTLFRNILQEMFINKFLRKFN